MTAGANEPGLALESGEFVPAEELNALPLGVKEASEEEIDDSPFEEQINIRIGLNGAKQMGIQLEIPVGEFDPHNPTHVLGRWLQECPGPALKAAAGWWRQVRLAAAAKMQAEQTAAAEAKRPISPIIGANGPRILGPDHKPL